MNTTTFESMPRLARVVPESDGVLRVASIPPKQGVNEAIEAVTLKRRATGIYLSPQRFLELRFALAPPRKAMHVQPLHDSEGHMVKPAISINGVPVFEDDEQKDAFITWTEAAVVA